MNGWPGGRDRHWEEGVDLLCAHPGEGRSATQRDAHLPNDDPGVLADWLVERGVTVAAMESTATYWKPVLYCLEEHVECWLLNAGHMKAVPGRKSDVKDAEWIAQLVEHGAW